MPVVIPEEYVPIPTADYRVRLKALVFKPSERQGWDDQFQWDIEVSTGEHTGRKLRTWSGTTTGPKAKFTRYAQAFGAELEIGVPFDTDNLLESEAIATVIDEPRKDGTPGNTIAAFKPLPKQFRPPAPAYDKDDAFASPENAPSTPQEQKRVHIAATSAGLTKNAYLVFLGRQGFAATSELTSAQCADTIAAIGQLSPKQVEKLNSPDPDGPPEDEGVELEDPFAEE